MTDGDGGDGGADAGTTDASDGPDSADATGDAETIPEAVRERIAADPYCAALGIDLVALGPGTATTELVVTEDLLNFHGTLHGGALYSLADAAFAAASNARGETALALETNVSYLEAVDAGTTLRATATETHLSDRTAEYEVVVSRIGEDGRAGGDGETADGDGEAADADRVATFRGRVYRP